jgi:hypothetical protein
MSSSFPRVTVSFLQRSYHLLQPKAYHRFGRRRPSGIFDILSCAVSGLSMFLDLGPAMLLLILSWATMEATHTPVFKKSCFRRLYMDGHMPASSIESSRPTWYHEVEFLSRCPVNSVPFVHRIRSSHADNSICHRRYVHLHYITFVHIWFIPISA